MAIDQTIDTKLMAQRYADAVREMPSALDLYYQQYRGVAEFWLVTSPIDVDTELKFYEASNVLYKQFPDTLIDFHVINPDHYAPFDLSMILPKGVSRIVIHMPGE